jgi:hypothetical protein
MLAPNPAQTLIMTMVIMAHGDGEEDSRAAGLLAPGGADRGTHRTVRSAVGALTGRR